MIFFKPKKIILNCYTARSDVEKYAPIQRGTHFQPQWWKDLATTYKTDDAIFPKSTMKRCNGFLDFYRRSAIMPMWCDMAVEIGAKGAADYKYQFSDLRSRAEHHDSRQRGAAFPESDFQHLKIISPWALETEQDVDWHLAAPTWNWRGDEPYCLLPGLVNFKHQRGANINLMFRRAGSAILTQINFRTPILHMLPLTEHQLDIRCHLVSEQEFAHKSGADTSTKFVGKYFANKAAQKDVSACPFG